MISTKIYMMRTVAALLLCVVAISCSQNDPDPGEGKPLRPGQYPLTFVASVEGLASRAAGHDAWEDGDEIGIRIGTYPKVGHYTLNADGTVMSAENALDWQTTAPSTVKAWFPYVALDQSKTIEMDNQTAGLEPYDFLTAIAEDQVYTKTVNMNFKHQMAKVSCQLVKDDELSDAEFESAKVSIAGYTVASFSDGVLTGSYKDGSSDNKWITPFYGGQSDYEALIVPQDMTGKEFIKIEITARHNGNAVRKALIYTPDEGALQPQAGLHNKYKITVKKDRLEVQSIKASWEDDGDWHPAGPAVFHVNIPQGDDIPTLTFSDNVKKEGNNLLVTGNRFSIYYEVTDDNNDNLLKGFPISKTTGDSDNNKATRTVTKIAENKFIYEFSYYILSEEVTLEYGDFVQVGDYYFSDGSWGPLELKGKNTPIGVVLRVGAGGYGNFVDKPADYGWEKINGYAVALNDATENMIKWGAEAKAVETYSSYSAESTPYSGYKITKDIKSWGEGGKDKKKHDYDAAKAALEYRTVVDGIELNAPEGKSSGWYLPTPQQLVDIQNIPHRAELFNKVQGKDVKSGIIEKEVVKNGTIEIQELTISYWSCLESGATQAHIWHFDEGESSTTKVKKSTVEPFYVRAVLTF